MEGGDDDESLPADHAAGTHTITHSKSSRYLAEKGVSAALEFRDLPLTVVERTWHDVMGRDSGATPGAVVLALRAIITARAAVPPATEDVLLDVPPPATNEDVLLDTVGAAAPPPADGTIATVQVGGEAQRRTSQLWQATLGALQSQLPGQEFDMWLRGTALHSIDSGMATIGAASAFQKEGLENRYLGVIRRALGEVLGVPVRVRVVLWHGA